MYLFNWCYNLSLKRMKGKVILIGYIIWGDFNITCKPMVYAFTISNLNFT